jgi:hypothetical protein
MAWLYISGKKSPVICRWMWFFTALTHYRISIPADAAVLCRSIIAAVFSRLATPRREPIVAITALVLSEFGI